MKIEKGIIKKNVKAVIYGVEGIGKTTLASQFPNPLIIDLENGSTHLDVSRARISSWPDFLAALDQLQRDTMGFETLVVDSADWAEDLCTAHVLARDKKDSIEAYGYGKGYVIVNEEYQRMFTKLSAINAKMHVVLIAHAEVKRTDLPDDMGSYDRYEPKLGRQSKAMLKEWPDALLFAKWKTKIAKTEDGKAKGIGGRERILLCQHDAAWDAKNRHGLPMELPMHIDALAPLFGEAAKATPATKQEAPAEPTSDARTQAAAPNSNTTTTTARPQTPLQKLRAACAEHKITETDVLQFLNFKKLTEVQDIRKLPDDLLLRCAKNITQIAQWAATITPELTEKQP